jgi:hypothetical protein
MPKHQTLSSRRASHDERNIEAANAIVENADRYGEESALVQWARTILRKAGLTTDERRNASADGTGAES